MHRGFSLVELSIVLVILGLLTGGILAGQSLIRAAELRSVSTEYSRYISAVQSFRDKYFALPGDMNNATKFWLQVSATPATCYANTTNDARTCDGNGDGRIEFVAGSNEHFRFWQHLANAGLVEGSYTGIEGSVGNVYDSTAGINVPKSKLGNAQWFARDLGDRLGHAEMFDGSYSNSLVAGGRNGTSMPYAPVFKPEEAWNIDTKMDDGKPATGSVRPAIRVGSGPCTVKADGSAMAVAATDAALSDAQYALTINGQGCALYFLKAF